MSRTSDLEVDVMVIGGGPAGYHAAIRAAQLGGKVAVIEKDELGGTCTNRGCIPTKALIKSVEILTMSKRAAEFGVTVENPAFDFAKMMSRKDRVVKQLRAGIKMLLEKREIMIIKGSGTICEPTVVETISNGERQEIKAKNIIIATGSVPAKVPIPGIDGEGVITSDEALELTQVPSSIAIIGAGAIGIEFGFIFNKLGAKVTIMEMMPQILPLEDEEIAAELTRILKRDGIKIFTSAKVNQISDKNGEKLVSVSTEAGEEEISAEKVLVAVGRRPYTEGLGLQEMGIETDRGWVVTNQKMQTNIPNIYAAGDVIGGILLAHMAFAEGSVAAENSMGKDKKIDYRVVPSCIYCSPQIGRVGLTEKEAKEQGYEIEIGKFPFLASGMATTIGEREGLVKVIAQKGSGKILGVHILGSEATELIAEASLAMQLGATFEDIAQTIHAHPTLAEAIGEAAMDVRGEAIHKV